MYSNTNNRNNITTKISVEENRELLRLVKKNKITKSKVIRQLIFNYIDNNSEIDFEVPENLESYIQVTFSVDDEEFKVINDLVYENLPNTKSDIVRTLIRKALNNLEVKE